MSENQGLLKKRILGLFGYTEIDMDAEDEPFVVDLDEILNEAKQSAPTLQNAKKGKVAFKVPIVEDWEKWFYERFGEAEK